jgi:hypothetical protein
LIEAMVVEDMRKAEAALVSPDWESALKTEDNIAFDEEASGPLVEGCQLVKLLLVFWWSFLQCSYDVLARTLSTSLAPVGCYICDDVVWHAICYDIWNANLVDDDLSGLFWMFSLLGCWRVAWTGMPFGKWC